MTTTCPACNNTVDPLRSRFVGVQDGKIVAYCSAECAGRTKPSEPARPAPPAMLVAVASPAMVVAVASPAAGVPVRIATPPVGVPARVQPSATGVPARVQPPATGVPARVQPPATGVPARVQPPATGVPARVQPPATGVPLGPLGPPRPNTPATGVPARVQTPATGVPLGPLGPPRPNTPAPGVPIDPARSSGVVDSGPVIEIFHEPASGVVTSARDERTEPRAKHPDEVPIAELRSTDPESSGAVRTAGEPASGPVALSEAGDRATSADRTAAERRRAIRPPAERGAGEPRDSHDFHDSRDSHDSHDSGDDLDAVPPRKSRVPLVILLLVLLGAGGYLAYQYFLKGNLAAATKVTPAPAARASPLEAAGGSREPATPRGAAGNPQDQAIVESHPPARRAAAAPPVVDVNAAVEQARATLHGALTATSPRVQRIAAEALARTQDPAARAVLAAQLGLPAAADPKPHAGSAAPPVRERETSDIAKLDLAYSLARGGDPRGAQALAAALGSQRAEVRDEAARLLALLGDARAVPHLTDLLAVSQRRLGAAEHLAHLAEPHAIKVLEQIRGDAKTSADDRARATIALGIARHADVAPALRDMLGDPHENAFAAAALAELEDAAARPVLEQQLESPALRVRAARALRRLDPALDPKPVLARLVEVLKIGRDIDQVQAAEAILLLAGPASWSAYD